MPGGCRTVVGNFDGWRAVRRHGGSQWASVLRRRTGASRLFAPWKLAPKQSLFFFLAALAALGVAVGVLGDEDANELGQLLLLAAGEAGGLLQHFLQLAFGDAALGWSGAEQFVDRDAQGLGHFGQDLAAGRFAPAFPESDVRLVDTDLVRQLLLGQACGFAQGDEFFTVFRPGSLSRASHTLEL
jgi:hypothetical protein